MKAKVISIVTFCLLLTGFSQADEASEKAMKAAIAMTKARQGFMRLQAQQLGKMGTAAKGAGPIDAVTIQGAQNLYNLTQMFPDIFGAGSSMEDLELSNAKPDVWTMQEELGGFIARLERQSERLLTMAKAGDSAGFKDEFKQVSGTCKKCHEIFRFVP